MAAAEQPPQQKLPEKALPSGGLSPSAQRYLEQITGAFPSQPRPAETKSSALPASGLTPSAQRAVDEMLGRMNQQRAPLETMRPVAPTVQSPRESLNPQAIALLAGMGTRPEARASASTDTSVQRVNSEFVDLGTLAPALLRDAKGASPLAQDAPETRQAPEPRPMPPESMLRAGARARAKTRGIPVEQALEELRQQYSSAAQETPRAELTTKRGGGPPPPTEEEIEAEIQARVEARVAERERMLLPELEQQLRPEIEAQIRQMLEEEQIREREQGARRTQRHEPLDLTLPSETTEAATAAYAREAALPLPAAPAKSDEDRSEFVPLGRAVPRSREAIVAPRPPDSPPLEVPQVGEAVREQLQALYDNPDFSHSHRRDLHGKAYPLEAQLSNTFGLTAEESTEAVITLAARNTELRRTDFSDFSTIIDIINESVRNHSEDLLQQALNQIPNGSPDAPIRDAYNRWKTALEGQRDSTAGDYSEERRQLDQAGGAASGEFQNLFEAKIGLDRAAQEQAFSAVSMRRFSLQAELQERRTDPWIRARLPEALKTKNRAEAALLQMENAPMEKVAAFFTPLFQQAGITVIPSDGLPGQDPTLTKAAEAPVLINDEELVLNEELEQTETWAIAWEYAWPDISRGQSELHKETVLAQWAKRVRQEKERILTRYQGDLPVLSPIREGEKLQRQSNPGMWSCQFASAGNALRILGVYDPSRHSEQALINVLGGEKYAQENPHGATPKQLVWALKQAAPEVSAEAVNSVYGILQAVESGAAAIVPVSPNHVALIPPGNRVFIRPSGERWVHVVDPQEGVTAVPLEHLILSQITLAHRPEDSLGIVIQNLSDINVIDTQDKAAIPVVPAARATESTQPVPEAAAPLVPQEKPAGGLNLVVSNVPEFPKALSVQRALQGLDGVREAKATGYEKGVLAITLDYDPAKAQSINNALAQLLEQRRSEGITIEASREDQQTEP